MSKYRYELRIIDGSEYNSHADVSFFYFTNGYNAPISPAGHSDKRRFPSGTTVLVRLRKATGLIKGYYMESFANITKFSKNGRPVEFGDSLSNKIIDGYWEPPTPDEIIYDARTKKVKEII